MLYDNNLKVLDWFQHNVSISEEYLAMIPAGKKMLGWFPDRKLGNYLYRIVIKN